MKLKPEIYKVLDQKIKELPLEYPLNVIRVTNQEWELLYTTLSSQIKANYETFGFPKALGNVPCIPYKGYAVIK